MGTFTSLCYLLTLVLYNECEAGANTLGSRESYEWLRLEEHGHQLSITPLVICVGQGLCDRIHLCQECVTLFNNIYPKALISYCIIFLFGCCLY